jgi:hypothetical protein
MTSPVDSITRPNFKLNCHLPGHQHIPARVPEVHFEISDFGFEMTSLSGFKTPDFGIPDYRFPIPFMSYAIQI